MAAHGEQNNAMVRIYQFFLSFSLDFLFSFDILHPIADTRSNG
jgi:hypothetical protein